MFLKEVSVPVVDEDIDYENTDDDEDALESGDIKVCHCKNHMFRE